MYHKTIAALFFFSLILTGSILAQDNKIIWADRVLESNPRFEYEYNHVGHALGLPSIYQGMMYGKLDPHADGYILYNLDALKKNSFTVGFSKSVHAQQIIIGGVLNMGSIFSISAITPSGKEVEIYQMMKGSVTKFHNFYTFFTPMDIKAIKIIIDHKKVRDWNLIKGIGITNMDLPLELMPDIYVDDEFHGKEKIDLHPEKGNCHTFNHKLSHDGKIVYYVKECPGKNDQDIWFAESDDKGKWSAPKKASFPLNNDGHNFVTHIGREGNFLLLGNSYNPDGSNGGDGVSISHKKQDGTWEIPKTLTIAGFKNYNNHANFFMSNDENVLIMAIEDDNTMGDLDLYVSFYDSTKSRWTKPKNLGPVVNTNFTEDYPYLSNDGKSLYFSSTGYIGFGGHDLYVTHRLDDSWTKWSKPLNLGALVNSKSDDHGFYIASSGDHAFFNTPNFETDTSGIPHIHRINLPRLLRQEEKVTVIGKVVSAKDSAGLEASLKLKNAKGELISSSISNPYTGQFILAAAKGEKYIIEVERKNYFKLEELIEINAAAALSDFKIKLSPFPDSGQTEVLQNIVFVKGGSEVSTVSGPVLDSLITKLKNLPELKFEIGVHTDSKGDPIKNKKLTSNRALSLEKYFLQNGIPKERMIVKGYGSDKPVGDNNTEAGRVKNRRVTLTYLTRYHTASFDPSKDKNKATGLKAP